MLVQVIFTGDQFVAYDARGNPVNDRRVLEQISFEQMMTNNSTSFYVKVPVDTSQDPAIMNDVKINISTHSR
jgi:hypothetical protein